MKQEQYEYSAVEEKWQTKWFETQIFEAKKQHNKKFFIHFAYPGVSGYLHVGHMRGFTYCDIIARYKRMKGYDVLFPAGFHASGIPSIGFAKKVQRGDTETLQLLRENGCTDAGIKKLEDPHEVVRFFSKIYVEEYWKRFGFLIDYTRLMDTISPGYQQFITWQFHKLNTQGLLIQKPHYAPYCGTCGPVAVDKSETDVSKGGSSEILEFIVIKFKLKDGTILPAATLRPETIFGVTNMWVHPDAEYEKVRVHDETWICSKACIEKLSYQLDNVKPLNKTVSGKDLIGNTCIVPVVNRQIPILSGLFADPQIATGVVMSVPAHAPYDWIALVESKEPITPISIIDVPGFGTNPAKEVCDQLGVTCQKETTKLDEATALVYKKEFHTGYLNEQCGKYAGIRISDSKDSVKNDLLNEHLAAVMREFSEEVVCRCGGRVFIKQIPDQWFIKYSDQSLTKDSIAHVQSMDIYPSEYKQEMPKVLEWFDDRAVIRKGSWLGTEFPFKKDWIIEPISDSTLYPLYYLVSKYVNTNMLPVQDMTLEFFDYIFLNKGKPKNKLWKTIQEDVCYWYPVDINLGGKEHKTVHFPVFVMNHVAVLPEQKRPRGIFVHWWVTQKGKEKISKSKGGAEPIIKAAELYGVDAMRLYYTHVGSPFVDIEWDPDIVTKYKNRITNIYRLFHQIQTLHATENPLLDSWLTSTIHRHIQKISTAFDSYDLRVASNEIYFELHKTIHWYVKRGGSNTQLLQDITDLWIRLMTPCTPHLAEELWHQRGKTSFVSTEAFPSHDPTLFAKECEVGEFLVSKVVDDVNEIVRVANITPKTIHLYVSPEWKQRLYHIALTLFQDNKLEMGSLMKTVMTDQELRTKSKQVSQAAGTLVSDIKKMNDDDRVRYQISIDEYQYLKNAQAFLEKTFSAHVTIYSADDDKKHDPMGKSKFAAPLRPAIYIE